MKILCIGAPPDLPVHPRLLQIKGKLFKADFGSPIVNDKAKIVALYCETTQPAGMEEINLAPLLIPEIITPGLTQRDGKIWISADLYNTNSGPADQK